VKDKVRNQSVPGNGARVRLVNPVKHTEILGEVIRWTLGDPQVRVHGTGEVRYYPKAWITEVSQ
jgi:hypothetical protein